MLRLTKRSYFLRAGLIGLSAVAATACSSTPPMKQQAYAKLSDHRTFEYDFPAVWGGVETVFKEYTIKDRSPDHVTDKELETLKERHLETDWAYTQSRDKYQEYQINGTPRKKYLQMRVKYEVNAKAVMGGVDVTVKTSEEIERLKPDGSSAGYSRPDAVDSSRPAEILDKVNQMILAAQPDK